MNHPVRFVAAALLVLAPSTYLVIAAEQSRGGSDTKERISAATEPLPGRPGSALRRIYDVPLPAWTVGNQYFETNSWQTSSLYVRFQTSSRGLDAFLHELGVSREQLRPGSVPITARQQQTFGWNFHGQWATQQRLAGLVKPAKGKGRPEHRVLVNLADGLRPTVYTVATVSY